MFLWTQALHFRTVLMRNFEGVSTDGDDMHQPCMNAHYDLQTSQDRRSGFTEARARARSMVPTKLCVDKGQLQNEGMKFAATPDLVSPVD
jgi:hypothetical protein